MRIFLTGFPASGKSFLGRLWAKENNLQFYDLDMLIAEDERMPVDKIFSTYGEGYFREKEAAVLRNTDRFDDCIIACGGGTPCFFDNADWMSRNGVVVFLDQSKEKLAEYLGEAAETRPLQMAAGSIQNFIDTIYEERRPFYQKATLTLSAEKLHENGFEEVLKYIDHA